MFGKMVCLSLVSIILSAALILIPACASAPVAETTSPAAISTTPVNSPSQSPTETEFARMLGYVPYSFLQKHDAWFGDPARAKQLYGIQDVNSLDSLKQLSPDRRKQVDTALEGITGMFNSQNWQSLAPVTGYDVWSVDRSIFTDVPPSWVYYVSEGTFDKDLIIGKLTGLGYQKVDHGSFSYYSINADFSPGDLTSPVSQQVLGSMNRVFVTDNMAIIAPATDILTGILDVMAGKSTSITDSPAGKALAASLGDVLSGVILNPERTINMNPPQAVQPFNFKVPADWGTLHQYAMTGIGFKNNGQDRYLVFSLYYTDAAAAQGDAGTLVNRMQSYILNTQFDQSPNTNIKPVPFTDKFDIGEPDVQQYPGGATLTVECRFKPDTPSGYWIIPMATLRDFLFLAPDPSPYVAQP